MSQLSNLFKKVYEFESKNYKKIDLFIDGKYVCSTTRSKTCKAAISTFEKMFGKSEKKVTANFA